MREQLIKAMQRNQLVDIMYVTRCEKRPFLINKVLIVIPFVSKECKVV